MKSSNALARTCCDGLSWVGIQELTWLVEDTSVENEIRRFLAECCLAERVGFEPTVPFQAHTLSRRASSATPASLRLLLTSSFEYIGNIDDPTKLSPLHS
jgi:hypothetical protein